MDAGQSCGIPPLFPPVSPAVSEYPFHGAVKPQSPNNVAENLRHGAP